MNARRMIQCLMLMTAMIAAFGFGNGDRTASASDGIYWAVNQSTGCLYFGDGTVSYVSACPRSDGWYDIYEADSGQWIYRGLGYWDVNSCFSFWDGGDVSYTSCSSVAQQSAPTYYATIGGTGYSTGNATVDAINNAYNNYIVNTWLQPSCAYVSGDTCYVS